eukprot:TRINITY_DN2271_c0_g1_i1.p1 TRINITY_DN2271_c0_g1~~TRINITY_DN2271_c0_g1_i1.p1  ORF type:complete len:194 (+),score=32.41 TRINITY_DN2271_c0_g1_i1:276-857(+)
MSLEDPKLPVSVTRLCLGVGYKSPLECAFRVDDLSYVSVKEEACDDASSAGGVVGVTYVTEKTATSFSILVYRMPAFSSITDITTKIDSEGEVLVVYSDGGELDTTSLAGYGYRHESHVPEVHRDNSDLDTSGLAPENWSIKIPLPSHVNSDEGVSRTKCKDGSVHLGLVRTAPNPVQGLLMKDWMKDYFCSK